MDEVSVAENGEGRKFMVLNGRLKKTLTASGQWGGWAVAVSALLLLWNVYANREARSERVREIQTLTAIEEAQRWAKVLAHIESSEPLIAQHNQMRSDVQRHQDAIVTLQTAILEMKEDLRAIRDYIYGRRPREPVPR